MKAANLQKLLNLLQYDDYSSIYSTYGHAEVILTLQYVLFSLKSISFCPLRYPLAVIDMQLVKMIMEWQVLDVLDRL